MHRTYRFSSWALALTGVAALVVGASAQPGAFEVLQPAGSYQDLQDPPPQQDPPAQPGRGGGRGNQPSPRPYDQVITKEAKTDDGIFKVHRIGETLYYEIPKAQLGKDFLWQTPRNFLDFFTPLSLALTAGHSYSWPWAALTSCFTRQLTTTLAKTKRSHAKTQCHKEIKMSRSIRRVAASVPRRDRLHPASLFVFA